MKANLLTTGHKFICQIEIEDPERHGLLVCQDTRYIPTFRTFIFTHSSLGNQGEREFNYMEIPHKWIDYPESKKF